MKRTLRAFVVALVFLLVFSWSTSPLYLSYGNDSVFFQTIGLGILQGKVPYVDLFDHKGPVPFFMNALGYSIGSLSPDPSFGRTGLFILQVISLTVTLLLLGKLSSCFVSSGRRSFLAVGLALIPMVDFVIEGNQVEEWLLPFVALSLVIVTQFVQSRQMSAWRALLLGVSLGVCFYTRPNDGVMWIGGLCLGLVIICIRERRWRTLLSSSAAALGGFAAVSAPVFLYFASHGAVGAMMEGMIWHNLRYASDGAFTWGGIGMILIPAIIIVSTLVFLPRESRRDWTTVLCPMLLFTVLFIGKRDYYHYLLPLIPYVVICMSLALEYSRRVFLWVVCSLFALFSFQECRYISQAARIRSLTAEVYEQTDRLLDNVPLSERNSIWNYNLFNLATHGPESKLSLAGALLHKGLTPSNSIIIAYDLMYFDAERGIRAKAPEWVLMSPEAAYNKDFDYIFSNYDLLATTPEGFCCEIRLYKRKQCIP